jgi:hypothetical protein
VVAAVPVPSARSSRPKPTAESTVELTSTLKLKLSQLMDYLNQQLEIVVDLEKESEKLQADPGAAATNVLELRDEILAISEQEQELIVSFQRRLAEKF